MSANTYQYVPSPANAAATISAVAAAAEGLSLGEDPDKPDDELTASFVIENSTLLKSDGDVEIGGGGEKVPTVAVAAVVATGGGESNKSPALPSCPLERGEVKMTLAGAIAGTGAETGAETGGGGETEGGAEREGGAEVEVDAGGKECSVFERTYSSAAAAI